MIPVRNVLGKETVPSDTAKFTCPPEMVKSREGRVVFKLPDLGINNTTAPGGSQKNCFDF
jgi:hypothetical protein